MLLLFFHRHPSGRRMFPGQPWYHPTAQQHHGFPRNAVGDFVTPFVLEKLFDYSCSVELTGSYYGHARTWCCICLTWDLGILAILHKFGVISLPMLSHVFGTQDSDGKTISYQASKTNSSKKSSLTPPLEILPCIYIIISHTPTSFDEFRICKIGICKIL